MASKTTSTVQCSKKQNMPRCIFRLSCTFILYFHRKITIALPLFCFAYNCTICTLQWDIYQRSPPWRNIAKERNSVVQLQSGGKLPQNAFNFGSLIKIDREHFLFLDQLCLDILDMQPVCDGILTFSTVGCSFSHPIHHGTSKLHSSVDV